MATNGLNLIEKTRVDLDAVDVTLALTFEEAILMGPWKNSADIARAWLARAERAHRIAGMLTPKDAAAVEAYAKECEVEARQQFDKPAAKPLTAKSVTAKSLTAKSLAA